MSKILATVPLIGEERKGGHKCGIAIYTIEEQLKQMGVMLEGEKIVQVSIKSDSLEFVMERVDND